MANALQGTSDAQQACAEDPTRDWLQAVPALHLSLPSPGLECLDGHVDGILFGGAQEYTQKVKSSVEEKHRVKGRLMQGERDDLHSGGSLRGTLKSCTGRRTPTSGSHSSRNGARSTAAARQHRLRREEVVGHAPTYGGSQAGRR